MINRNPSKGLEGSSPHTVLLLLPRRGSPSLTHVDPLCDFTLITQHVTAPVETTVAALHSRLPEHVVPTATAQAATAIQQAAGLVASPASRAWGAQSGVSLTEVRGLLKVNQLP